MFLCAECDPCGGPILDGGRCIGLESRGRCESCDQHTLCTDCHSHERRPFERIAYEANRGAAPLPSTEATE